MISESASRARRLAALSAMPGCGRSSARSAANAASVPSWRLHAHRRGDVRGAQQQPQVVAGQHEHAEHAVGAVDQRQALLLGQHHRLDPGRGQRVGRRRAAPRRRSRTVPSPVTASAQCASGARSPGAAQRAVLAHHRGDPGGDQRRVGPGGLQPDPGAAGGQRGQPQQHHRPHHLALHLGPGPGRVRADQAALQQHPALARDVPGGQRAEPGGDAVLRLRCRRPAPRPPPGSPRCPARPRSDRLDRGAAAGHRDDLLPAERPGADGDRRG